MKIKKKFMALCETWKDDRDMLEFLEDAGNRFVNYVDSVVRMEKNIPIIRFTKEGQDLIDAIEGLDRTRRNYHEAAIAAVKSLGRAARADGLEPIFDGDETDRQAIADFCLAFVNEFFQDRATGVVCGKLNLNKIIQTGDRGGE